MKVTVAFGDVKVVVPCGNGDITIRQLSELAITRYQKSLQQDSLSPRMSVNINALVLARDCGILDWDDSVSDVVDDRELIIARFLTKPNPYGNNNNASKHMGAVTNSASNNNHYFCPEWNYCMPITTTATDPIVASSNTDENAPYNNPTSVDRNIVCGFDSTDNLGLLDSGKNGSCIIPVSPDSVDSAKQMGDNMNTDRCGESSCLQNATHWNQCHANKENFSFEESDSSQWPVPPPLIITTSDDSVLINRAIFHNASHTKYITTSSSNSNEPSSHSKPYECATIKKIQSQNMDKSVCKTNHDALPGTSSLSPSLPSNADAKSLPQSFYSSLESTAVSENNNSSYDETNNEEPGETSKSMSNNRLEERNDDEKEFKFKSKIEPLKFYDNAKESSEKVSMRAQPTDVVDCLVDHVELESSLNSDENQTIKSQNFNNYFSKPGYTSVSTNSSKLSTSIHYHSQMPPPMPPLRSAFTKLSPNPIKVSIPPANFLQISDSDLALPSETISCLQMLPKTSTSQLKTNDMSKSEHSIPSLFESEDRIVDDMENEWSLSGKSGDQESNATTTTTETSVNTSATTTTTSHSTLNKTAEKYILTVSLKKSANGFGFSLTSRQNPVDLTNPVYVSKVLENGPAIIDGRMKSGDRIITINDEDVTHLSQKNIKDILLNIPTESVVKIGLFRPSSDAISNLLDAINTTSTSQKKNSIPQVLNHTGDKDFNEDCNQICVEEQKPVSFPMCTCIQRNSQPCSKLNLYHFIITLRPAKSEYLTPQLFDRSSPDTIPKTSSVRHQNMENKIEPPAIPLNHQNKLSPCSFSNKIQTSMTTSKASNAALGISVRRGISQMSFNDSYFDSCHNACHGQSKHYPSSKNPNHDSPESFSPNNYTGNSEESVHKFCPNCHGLLSLKNGVFVKSIIPGGAAHMDARVLTGDEIVAVQGVCLHNGEDFIPPNNKILLGDVYDSLKFAQVPLKFHNRIHNSVLSSLDSNDKIDSLTLLKQILSHAQSTCSSVSLTILRRSLEQRSCSINTLASVDANCCHNVTVAADIHTPYKNDDFRTDNLFSFIMPNVIPAIGATSMNKQRLERFEEYHNRDHSQRYYRDDRDSPEHHTSDLICLQSDHGSDDPIPAVLSENNSIPSPSHTNNASLADSYHVSSGILTDYETERVPIVSKTIYNGSSFDGSVDNLVSLRHANNKSSSSSILAPQKSDHLGADLNICYFDRNNSARQSFSTKRTIFSDPKSATMLKRSVYTKSYSSLKGDGEKKCNTINRPSSELILCRVPEEDPSDCLSPSPLKDASFEYSTQTVDRKNTLRRRGGIVSLNNNFRNQQSELNQPNISHL